MLENPNDTVKRIFASTAIHHITQPMVSKGWGIRHLWVGYSGCGKTYANCFVYEYLRRYGIVCCAVDQKALSTPYPGEKLGRVEEFGPRHNGLASCVIRGFAASLCRDDFVDFDVLAGDALARAKGGERVALFPDELSDACAGERTWKGPRNQLPNMSIVYKQGREIGLSISACTQLPQEIPRTASRLSDSTGYFRMNGSELNYLVDNLQVLTPAEGRIVADLPDYTFLLNIRGHNKKYVCKF